MRKTFATIVVALLAGLGLTLAASPASAHTYTAYQGSDYGTVVHGYTCPTNGTPCYYRKMTVVDKECDGNAVWLFYEVNTWVYSLKDANGCSSGGTTKTLSSGSVASFKVCEQTGTNTYACSGWLYPVVHASA